MFLKRTPFRIFLWWREYGDYIPTQINDLFEAIYCHFTISYKDTLHHENFNKQIVKSPKLYFYDTGLLCYLLGLESHEQLMTHYLWGSIFENFIIADIMKSKFHSGCRPNLYFWQYSSGNEIDCLEEQNGSYKIMEIKASKTFHYDFLKNLDIFRKITKKICWDFDVAKGEWAGSFSK